MANFGSKIHIEAMQTPIPTKPTDPRKSYTILNIPQNDQKLYSTILQRRFQIILCYNKSSEDDSGWMLAGWMRESLGGALAEQPIFAGRLRLNSELESAGDRLHIVTNDSGVRLVEAKVDMKLADFLDLKSKRDAEVELVFWEDMLEDNPQLSPLFYVQITNFLCGGYSIGISCSILLADPFTMTSFLKKWANLHNNIVSNTDLPKIPTFYLPNLKNLSASTSLPIGSNTHKNAAQSVIFKAIPPKILNLDDNVFKNLATLCIDDAEQDVIGAKIDDKFSLFLKNIPFDHEDFSTRAEVCSRKGSSNKTNYGLNLSRTLWDDELGAEEICFNQENKPVYVSCWINSILDEGSVMIVSSDDHDKTSGILKIIVTFSTT